MVVVVVVEEAEEELKELDCNNHLALLLLHKTLIVTKWTET